MLQEALKEISENTASIVDEEQLKKLLKNYFINGINYTVKCGFDPTAPDLHLGHTVLLNKLAVFQKHGAIIQLLIGDFTATIGDPTGKNKTRKILTDEEIQENVKSYTSQVFKILDETKTEIVYNKSWLDKLGTAGLMELTSHLTVARILEREDFSNRYVSQTPIAVSEFIYPLLQGYDSVHLKSDIEIGGTDQTFNVLMGRQLQKIYGVSPQVVLTMPILEGLDGIQKMSKSLGNYIAVFDNPNDMFGKILSISDDLMWRYFQLISSKNIEEVSLIKSGVREGKLHPKKVKEELAIEIVTRFHSAELAVKAKEEFDKVHSSNQIPTDIDIYTEEDTTWIVTALKLCRLSPSNTQARRLIQDNAVSVNQKKIADEQLQLTSGEYILQVGKRKFAKLIVK